MAFVARAAVRDTGVVNDESRVLRWEACYNVRDLGGYPLAEGRETRWRALIRADTLCRLTDTGRAAVVDYGVRTVIDLRSSKEVAEGGAHPFANRAGHGVDYGHVPIIGLAAEEVLREATSTAHAYALMLDHCRSEFGRTVRAFARASEGGVVVHCGAGKDRTGLVVALLLALAGVPVDVIGEDYALTDVGLQPLYEEWLAKYDDPAEREQRARQLVSYPETIARALAHVDERYGGVAAYLEGVGVTAEERELARARLAG